MFEVKVPPPLVSSYLIFEVKPAVDPKTRQTVLVGDRPRGINTEDIKDQIGLQGLFIVAWQEIHYDYEFDSAGVPRITEKYVTRTHLENQARVTRLREFWANPALDPLANGPAQAPVTKSLEQELMSHGWQFHYEPIIGPAYASHAEEMINWVLEGGQPDEAPESKEYGEPVAVEDPYKWQPTTLPPEDVYVPAPESALSGVELKIDALVNSMQALIQTVAVLAGERGRADHNSVGDGQPNTPVGPGSDYIER